MKKLIPIILSVFFVFSYGATKKIENYPNGNKKSEGMMKGLFWKYKSGEWIYYYSNGNIKERGNYKGVFALKNDAWIYYYEKGQKWKEVEYKRGKEIKPQKEWYENEQIKEEWHLINNGTKDGIWISYYENGQIKEKEIYKGNGTKNVKSNEEIIKKYRNQDGTWINYYKKDRYGTWTSYYDNGQTKKEGFYKDGWKDGIWTSYYENGQKNVECTHNGAIVDPELGRSVHDGKYTVWTQDGQIKKEGNYIQGVNEWENVYNDPNSYTKVDTTKYFK